MTREKRDPTMTELSLLGGEQDSASIARATRELLPHQSTPASATTGRVGASASILLALPPPVSANVYWRSFVSRGGKRAIVVVSDEAKAYRQTVHALALAAGVRKPITGRVALTVRMYPARPLDWAKRAAKDPDGWDDTVRSIDLDNCLKVLLDALKNVAFDDDAWVRRIDAERCEPDEHGARVVVTVSPIVREPIAPELAL